MRRAVDLDKNNPYYMSYLGVVLARSEGKWGEAERLCDSAVRMKRNQAQLYLNLAEVYATAGRRDDAVDAFTDRAEICAPRYPADDRYEQTYGAPVSRPEFSRPETPAKPAARNNKTPGHADVRADDLNQFLHPQNTRTGVPIIRGARSCFCRLGGMAWRSA